MADPAVSAILRAFGSHAIVALGEAHQLRTLHEFLHMLICTPGFADRVDDLVVECGNALYQDIVDRYVAGEDLPRTELAQAWRNTTQTTGVWDSPVYAELFACVRGRGPRVVLADPAIDWSAVATAEQLRPYIQGRELHMAGVIAQQVLARGHKALFLAGSAHVTRRPLPSAVALVEERHPGAVFSILTHTDLDAEVRMAEWQPPALVVLQGTWLGALDAEAYFHGMPPFRGLRLEEVADAYLFLGSGHTLEWAPPDPSLYRSAYGAEVLRRRPLMLELLKLRSP